MTNNSLLYSGDIKERPCGLFHADNDCLFCRTALQCDELRAALRALYDAIPTGFGEDRALNEATKQAEKVLGISR